MASSTASTADPEFLISAIADFAALFTCQSRAFGAYVKAFILIASLKVDGLVLNTMETCSCMYEDASDLVAFPPTFARKHFVSGCRLSQSRVARLRGARRNGGRQAVAGVVVS